MDGDEATGVSKGRDQVLTGRVALYPGRGLLPVPFVTSQRADSPKLCVSEDIFWKHRMERELTESCNSPLGLQVIVQNYNSVLTLAHLYRLSDAILVHENDTVHRICSQLLNIKNISFSDVNRVMAQQLGGVLQPALTADSHGLYSRNPLGEPEDGSYRF